MSSHATAGDRLIICAGLGWYTGWLGRELDQSNTSDTLKKTAARGHVINTGCQDNEV